MGLTVKWYLNLCVLTVTEVEVEVKVEVVMAVNMVEVRVVLSPEVKAGVMAAAREVLAGVRFARR